MLFCGVYMIFAWSGVSEEGNELSNHNKLPIYAYIKPCQFYLLPQSTLIEKYCNNS